MSNDIVAVAPLVSGVTVCWRGPAHGTVDGDGVRVVVTLDGDGLTTVSIDADDAGVSIGCGNDGGPSWSGAHTIVSTDPDDAGVTIIIGCGDDDGSGWSGPGASVSADPTDSGGVGDASTGCDDGVDGVATASTRCANVGRVGVASPDPTIGCVAIASADFRGVATASDGRIVDGGVGNVSAGLGHVVCVGWSVTVAGGGVSVPIAG